MQTRLLVTSVGVALLLSPSASEQAKPRAILTVTTTDYAFQAPDTVSAGVVEVHLTHRGPGLHHVWLVRRDPGHRAVDVLKGFHEGRPTPAWAHDLGGPNLPAAGQPSVVLVTLTPGRYGLLCFIPDPDRVRHLMKGMVKEMTVVGPVRPGVPPRPTVTVKLVDYGFVLSAPLRAGHQVIAVRNEGTQSHMLVFLRLEPGKTPTDYLRWAERREGRPTALTFGGTTGMAPGVLNTIEIDLKPGEYGLMCFGPDVGDGKPHAAHGMMKQIRVSS